MINFEVSFMGSFVDKKEKLADLIDGYIDDNSKSDELLKFVDELRYDEDFRDKELFRNIFREIREYLSELSVKELKQRVLMIRSFME